MDEKKDRLISWKEIAAYLGCDVRTCLRWEKERGLPVHRPGGKPGPRVMSSKKELSEWLAGSSHPKETTTPPAEPALPGRLVIDRKWILIFVLLAVFGVAGFLGVRTLTMDREPADFRIDGSRLVILNAAKGRLWEFDTKMENLWTEAEYRKRFQTRRFDEEAGYSIAPCLAIEDIDADGHCEVLFTPHPTGGMKSNRLYCLDHNGKERWHFDGGREMVFGNKPFSWDYFSSFEIRDFDGDGRKEIALFSEQNNDFPTQLVILSVTGSVRGEYWNSGRIIDLSQADLDGDGRPEVIIGGVNNEYKKAFIAVFEPRNLAGSSPNTGTYKSSSLSTGTERAYVLLPWTDIDPYQDIHVVLASIEILANGRIRGLTSKSLVQYELDPRTLACLDVTLSNKFKSIHEGAVRNGQAKNSLDEAYRENLKKGFLYWTGRNWTSTPSAVIH